MSFNIILFNQKEEAQFNIVYKKYYSTIRYYTLKNVNGTEDVAEDITTECFMALWKNCADMQTEEHIKSFLYLKSKRDSINWTEKEKLKRKKADDIAYHIPTSEEITIEEDNEIVGAEVIRLIEYEMKKLPPVAGKVMRMYYEGKTTDEIAAITGAVAKTVLNQKNSSVHIIKGIIARFIKPILTIVLKDPSKRATKDNIKEEHLLTDREIGMFRSGVQKKLRKNTYKGFLNYAACGMYLAQQGIKSSYDFVKWKGAGKRPKFVPAIPHYVYPEWSDWETFLGVPNHFNSFMSYEAAKTWVKEVVIPRGIKSGLQLSKFIVNNPDIVPKDFPHYPAHVYGKKGEWVSWESFMGTEKWSYEVCRKWVHENLRPLGILTVQHYVEATKLIPSTMPKSNPKVYFTKYGQWVSEDDFFGRDESNKNGYMNKKIKIT